MLDVAVVLLALEAPMEIEPRQVHCVAEAVYHEARGESLLGQVAVANVVMNRVAGTGRTPCAVVYAPRQFSWSRRPPAIKDERAWRRCAEVAAAVAVGEIPDQTEGAVHFYDEKIIRRTPGWARSLKTTRVIGAHRFMKGKEK